MSLDMEGLVFDGPTRSEAVLKGAMIAFRMAYGRPCTQEDMNKWGFEVINAIGLDIEKIPKGSDEEELWLAGYNASSQS